MVHEAIEILAAVGLNKRLYNIRSGLTFLALLGLKPEDEWSDAEQRMIGITPMMEFFAEHYGKKYAPNSRETVRRQTIHQFVRHGIVIVNPDEPNRPTNSGKTVYMIESRMLRLVKSFGTKYWDSNLRAYRRDLEGITEARMVERHGKRITVRVSSNRILHLSPGGQNTIIGDIFSEFTDRFVPGGITLFVGDTAKDSGYIDENGLAAVGICIPKHGKIPDVIIHDMKNDWLFVIEVVSSHGPIDSKRYVELQELFSKCTIGIVYVTAFSDKRSMAKHIEEIAWETEVWCANDPEHMIHFDGSRFLGSYGALRK